MDMAMSGKRETIECKRKAITALFPYAVRQEREGEGKIMNALLTVFLVFGPTTSLWHPITPYITILFKTASAEAIVTISPHVPWYCVPNDASVVKAWAAAAPKVLGIDEVELRIVDALLQIASVDSLRPHIPRSSWSWLNKRPTLPSICFARSMATQKHVVRWVKQLQDVEILTSYFILVWSECNLIASYGCLSEMQLAISRDLRGRGMWVHRKALTDHLEHILGELEQGLGHLQREKPWIDVGHVQRAKAQYQKLKDMLYEMDGISTCKPLY